MYKLFIKYIETEQVKVCMIKGMQVFKEARVVQQLEDFLKKK